MTPESLRSSAEKVKNILGLDSSLVGVKFLFAEKELPPAVEKLAGHRYCQAVMKARHGAHVLLDADGIACPAAAAAFGFKPLPDPLKTGKGLVGFGITQEEHTGQTMFEGMTTLSPGLLKALYLFPLETAAVEPDVVVVEGEVEKLMWLALADLNSKGGHRVHGSTAILQAVCVDATLIPFVHKSFNMSMGCYGCRDATDLGPGETVLGFPFEEFEAIVQSVIALGERAIGNSRAKNALALLKRKDAEQIGKTDPFTKQSSSHKPIFFVL